LPAACAKIWTLANRKPQAQLKAFLQGGVAGYTAERDLARPRRPHSFAASPRLTINTAAARPSSCYCDGIDLSPNSTWPSATSPPHQ